MLLLNFPTANRWRAILFALLWLAPLTASLLARNTGHDFHSSLTGFHADVWKTAEGLPQNTVPAILQSKDGYLWAGTELGLVRFDGFHFTVFDKTNTPELKSNVVVALLEDRRGDLWIGTLGGGLTRYSRGKFRTYTTQDGLSSDSVQALLEDAAGDLWIGTDGSGLNRLHDGHFTVYTTASGLADNEVFALAQLPDGALWIGTHDGLSRFSDGEFRSFRVREGLPSNYVRSLLTSPDGVLWIGTYGGGLCRLAGGSFRTFSTHDGLSSNSVTSLRNGADKDVWIGTFGGGITRLSGAELSSYTVRDGLPSNDIWSIFLDRERNLWVGTAGGGITRLSQRPFTTFDKQSGLSNDVTLPVFEDHAGDMWIGTNGGGLNRLHNGQITTFTTREGLANDLVFSICEDAEGALWIGTRKGLNRFKNGKFVTYTTRDGLPSDIVIASLAGRDGSVWLGTRAGLSLWKNHRFTTFSSQDGLSSNVVQAIFEDSRKRLWIGTSSGGLNLFERGHFRVFNSQSGLSNNAVLSMHEGRDGGLWIGTDGGGLNLFQNGKFSVFTARDGLLDDAVFRILEDNSGHLWMSSNKGVFRVSLADFTKFKQKKIGRIPTVAYGLSDGMKTHECNGGFQPAGWKSHDGRLWFPTMQGVVAVDPRNLNARLAGQIANIEQVLINDRELDRESSRHVAPGAGKLEFHYTAPNFRAANRIRFRYRLRGFDTSWVEAGHRRVAYYTNIPPASYVFEVVASNEDGTWSHSAAALSFALQPHFYQTVYFYGLCILAFIALIFAAHLAHVRQLRDREKELARYVDERTAALRKEILEREKAEHESMRAKEAAERASRVKSEFLANMSHEIRTPMNGIVGMTSLALQTSLTEQQHQYLDIIRESADCLLTVIDDILDFSKVEAGKMTLDPIDFDFRESVASAVKSLAFRAEQNSIRLSLDIDPAIPRLVHADPVRLRQVLLNLLGNAIKFTRNGVVSLKIACDSADPSLARLHFVVADTGIGIAPEKLTSIFEAFSQADSSTTRKFGGTGLGLAICHRLVSLMGGSIWAESELKHGSQFHFTSEVGVVGAAAPDESGEAEAAKQQQSLAALAQAANQHLRILVAEDNPANRMVARLTLEHAGFLVFEAENGREALHAASAQHFDIILMDCRMPVMDGYVATRHIRQLTGPAARVPIIALSASAFQEDRERAEEAGMDDFIPKPFHDEELLLKCLTWAESSSRAATPPLTTSLKDRSVGASPEFLLSMFEIFLETVPAKVDALKAAIQQDDWKSAKASAHWLRGGALRLVDPGLQEQLQALEALCDIPEPSFTREELGRLDDQFKAAYRTAEMRLADLRGAAIAANVR